ncbi:tetratricopeptide repeat protein [Lysobacter sp. GX 14042]|uniref:tetratricopeptide repeat protein n=1 Tax=Lysobacter sp. GX 14042 TaxID=2907155 RepID=UPI001F2BDC4D|nr:tetratricopeptide repeat protein [Lysobacter sp. GX 14042]MCE7031219.1 tetratricopeptide repeat protein [Lysobacter sp. GX 14042]
MAMFVLASVALVVVVLAWVLRPLWRMRPAAGAGMLVLLALSAGLLYLQVGTPRALDPAERVAPVTLQQAIAQLEAELEREPARVEGWRLLGRAYLAQERAGDAVEAYHRALALAPDAPVLLTEMAEARARAAADRQFDAEGIELLERALASDPSQQRARWFLGIARRQAGDAAGAAETWQPLLAQVDGATAASLRTQIDQARADAGLDPLPAPEAATATDAAAVAVRISVSLDPGLSMQLPRGASLFVIARQPGGPPMPVAVRKLPLAMFPMQLTLTDADSLMPTMKLSRLDQVELSARISASGDATPQPGDLESAPATVATGPETAAALLIDKVVR